MGYKEKQKAMTSTQKKLKTNDEIPEDFTYKPLTKRRYRKKDKPLVAYYKEMKKEWATVIIIGLVAVMFLAIGIFIGLSLHPQPVAEYDTTTAQVDTVETNLISNSDWGQAFDQNAQDIQFKWTGKGINQNVTVTGFDCSIDMGVWFPCGNELAPVQPIGEHTFEVRAVGNDSNVDHTPATWVWSVK